jgi:hypothetical protein
VGKRVAKRSVCFSLAFLASSASFLLPNSKNFNVSPVSEYRTTNGCSPAPHENYGLIEVQGRFAIASNPNEYSVVLATERNFLLGTAITIDKYGNIFLSMRSAYSSDTTQYAVLLSKPTQLNSEHFVEIDFYLDKRIEVRFDGVSVPLDGVNGVGLINTRKMKTEISEICVNRFGSKNLSGVSLMTLKQYAPQLNIQFGFLKAMLLLVTLGLVLVLCKEFSKPSVDTDLNDQII